LIPTAVDSVTYRSSYTPTRDDPPTTVEEEINSSWEYEAESERVWVEVTHRGSYLGSDIVWGTRLKGYYGDRLGNEYEIKDSAGIHGKSNYDSKADGAETQGLLARASVEPTSLLVSAGGKLVRGHKSKAHASRLDRDSSDPVRPLPKTSRLSSNKGKWDTWKVWNDGKVDKMQVHTLLRLADLSLDAPLDDGSSLASLTHRQCGVVLYLSIEYSNMEKRVGWKVMPWGMNDIYILYVLGVGTSQERLSLRHRRLRSRLHRRRRPSRDPENQRDCD